LPGVKGPPGEDGRAGFPGLKGRRVWFGRLSVKKMK
jgi:hypothetical protein